MIATPEPRPSYYKQLAELIACKKIRVADRRRVESACIVITELARSCEKLISWLGDPAPQRITGTLKGDEIVAMPVADFRRLAEGIDTMGSHLCHLMGEGEDYTYMFTPTEDDTQ